MVKQRYTVVKGNADSELVLFLGVPKIQHSGSSGGWDDGWIFTGVALATIEYSFITETSHANIFPGGIERQLRFVKPFYCRNNYLAVKFVSGKRAIRYFLRKGKKNLSRGDYKTLLKQLKEVDLCQFKNS